MFTRIGFYTFKIVLKQNFTKKIEPMNFFG